MGDNGSMIIGFFLATLGIKALDPVLVHHSPAMGFNLIIFVISIMILPVADTIRVFIIRTIRRKSPFTPGKDHLHHLLIKQGIQTKQAVLVLYLINILFILSGFIMTGMLGNWSFDIIQSANY
jgi:UDP-N-acetylmuramyl pentapeptide phosphotransferase/UDP-N-acetylglucosamine-1-phosphate transferase